MDHVKAIVLRAAGINCDLETEHAFELAGASAKRVHINRLIENPAMLDDFQILVFPGGFSYGDDVAAGKILANQIIHHLYEHIKKFIDDGKLVLGICNGFQVLVKSGILPGLTNGDSGPATAPLLSIIDNDSGKYEDRWVHLKPATDRCVFIKNSSVIYLPVAHAEGKVVTKDEQTLEKLESDSHIAFRYVDAEGNPGPFPINPNGSMDHIAGLTDPTGRVLGLMPHPERFIRKTQHPHWNRLDEISINGFEIFTNAVNYIKQNL